MHAEIAAFFRENDLPDHLADALVTRLTGPPSPHDERHTFDTDEVLAVPVARADVPVPARYENLGVIGAGGMGEVRRVRDRELGRTCALKTLRAELVVRPRSVARFLEEARVAAGLQHPNLLPVYDAGRLPDGRPWFTMKEVQGRTLSDAIREAHAPPSGPTDAAFRRLCSLFAKVCDGVGYAHACGVVHRDLKPDNVMIGAHGEVLVLDWGLAKILLQPEVDPGDDDEAPRGASGAVTRIGHVLGTVAYMPPEQARGEIGAIDARSDVYALGAILYEILAGRPPYTGEGALAALLAGPPAAPTGPEELVALVLKCLARRPEARPPDGAAVAADTRAWLDGARRREKALEVFDRAESLVDEAAAQRAEARALRAEGGARLVGVPPWAPEEEKYAAWELEDRAEQIDRGAVLLELQREALLGGALTHAQDLVAAHAALAELELSRHRAAEDARDDRARAQAGVRLEEHVGALPGAHPLRVRVAAYLQGHGALTLLTDPPGAEVELHRYEVRRRRLVPSHVASLGRTPLTSVTLPMGSYLCVIRHPDRVDVRYPFALGRGEAWHGVRPGDTEPFPIRLPRPSELGPDGCYVPAGWFRVGGDALASDAFPRHRCWCDPFVVQRFPVTNRAWLAFLDDLVATGREQEALRHQPRERSAGEGAPVFARAADGRFTLHPDADGDVWDPDWPVVLVDLPSARAFAAWWASRSGHPWRIPLELEWEKAARGADGRAYPWGDTLDPSWCCIGASHSGRRMPMVVDSYPVDESPYGVRGLGGNVQAWCADVYRRPVPLPLPDVVSPADEGGEAAYRVHRGGSWGGTGRGARSAGRAGSPPVGRDVNLGVRLVFRLD